MTVQLLSAELVLGQFELPLVGAGVKNFIPAVKTCFMTSVDDEKYFLSAKVAFARCWGVARSLCNEFPFDFII